MSLVLVDSSVWIEMFRRGTGAAVAQLGELLGAGLACTNGLIRAEVLSGARSQVEFQRLADSFSDLAYLSDPPDLWDQIARTRFKLARRGVRTSMADLIIAVSASSHQKPLLTLDKAFSDIRSVLPLDLI